MEPATGVTDDVGFTALCRREASILDCAVNILVGVTCAEQIVPEQLTLEADRKLGLPVRIQVRIDKARVDVAFGSFDAMRKSNWHFVKPLLAGVGH